jgi:hypothetical protein
MEVAGVAAMKITAKVSPGPQKGAILEPHPYPGGKFVASPTRFSKDYIFVNYEDIPLYVKAGLSLRMSDPVTRKNPTLIRSKSISIS